MAQVFVSYFSKILKETFDLTVFKWDRPSVMVSVFDEHILVCRRELDY